MRFPIRFPDARSVAVLCGPGNNGGDGFVAARHLVERGYAVRLGFNGDPSRLPQDAAAMAKLWAGAVEPLHRDLMAKAEVVVDALFGAGLARPIEGDLAGLIEAVNRSGLPVIAVDVPSGVDGTTGAVKGVAIEAAATVTFFRLKPGHLLLPGRDLCGETRIADIGIPDSVLEIIKPKTFANEPALWLAQFPWPQPQGHKYARGHAVVASGPAFSTGAARLGAMGALRAGAGLVTVASPKDAVAVNAAQLTAIMVRPVDDANDLAGLLADERKNAVLIGPGVGVGERTKAMVLAALASNAAVVLDADAITSFADDAAALFAQILSRTAPVALTPHEGEFARLFGAIGEGGRLDAARAAAARSGAIVLLKGSDTIVAAPDGQSVDQRHVQPLARHRRHRRCACRHRARFLGAAHGALRRRLRFGLGAWARGAALRSGPDRRRSPQDASRGPGRIGRNGQKWRVKSSSWLKVSSPGDPMLTQCDLMGDMGVGGGRKGQGPAR